MSRLDWILGLALLVILAGAATLGIFFWQQSRLELAVSPQEGWLTAADEQDLRQSTAILAYGRAQFQVNQAHGSANLVSVAATWPPLTSEEDLKEGEAIWQFTYYKPMDQMALNATVVNEQATLGQAFEVEDSFDLLEVNGWKVDSQEAIEIFLSNGGSEFIGNEQIVSFSMQLSLVNDNGRMEWIMAAISDQTGNAFTMWLDATSGEVLDVQRVP